MASRYVLRQTRRMRSNERHYIDSPKFGVIAIITPSGSTEAWLETNQSASRLTTRFRPSSLASFSAFSAIS